MRSKFLPMGIKISGTAAVIIVAVLMAAGAYVFFGTRPNPAVNAGPVGSGGVYDTNDPATQLRMTLDPDLFTGEVKQAYQIARAHPALLEKMHCYCGCDRIDGHKNLLDCFRDRHGSVCAICTGEAIEAEQLAKKGMPVEQIRDALRARFARGS